MNQVTVYSTTWCGSCRRLKKQLTREGIAFNEIDIDKYPAAAEIVAAANNGDLLVPTVVLADGTVLSNPSVIQIKAHFAA